MKRLLLFVIVVLCIFAVSCTDNTVITPNEPEVVEPEVVEPEVVEPEVVEPEVVEPEVVEPELPFITEREINFGDEVRVLPAEDGDTKTVVIKFPEITLGYTEPELASPKDFKWGDYRPFVRYMIDSYGELGSTPIYSYAFLGSGINDLEEGNTPYEKLNEKYSRSIEPSEELAAYFPQWESSLIPYAPKSNIVYVSEDCSKTGVRYIEKDEASGVYHLKYDLYENGELSSSSTLPNNENGHINYSNLTSVNYFGGKYIDLSDSEDARDLVYCNNDGTLVMFTQRYGNRKDLITVYSAKENRLKYKIAMDFYQGAINTYTVIHQTLDDRYLLISFRDYFKGHGPCNNLYLLDLETEALSRMNGYCFNPLLSPDGKYLIYTNYYEFGQGVNSPCNESYDMRCGFYVKNLENGETTFFENKYELFGMSCNEPLQWVSRESLDRIIE